MPAPPKQRTLKQIAVFSGKGLHSGRYNRARLIPAPAGNGILFRRTDPEAAGAEIPASWQHIHAYPACTCLADRQGIQVRTVEHLLAAFYACGVDNAIVELQGDEIPILDGSAAPLVELIDKAGLQTQAAARRSIKVLRTVEKRWENRLIRLEPAAEFAIDLRISLRKIGPLNWSGPMSPERFRREIMGARSFSRWRNGIFAKLFSGFMKEPVYRGAGMDCAVVILGGGVLNKGGLRYPDEFVRHRVLDVIGDLQLAGATILGKVTASSTAHSLNHELLRALFSDDDNWRWQ